MKLLTHNKLFSPSIALQERILFSVFGLITLVCLLGALATENFIFAGVPMALLVGYIFIVDLKSIFYLILFVLPFTVEIYLPNGFGIDLPTEPLMIGLTGAYLIFLLKKPSILRYKYLSHPITLALFAHMLWIGFAALWAYDSVIGFKYFLAKIWYVVPFYFFPLLAFKSKKGYLRFFWILFVAITISIFYVLVRHSTHGFSFADVNASVSPIYRNHVNYASIMVIFLPFLWCMGSWYPKGDIKKTLCNLGIVLFLIAIYLTYTRAAQLSVFIAIGSYFIVQFRLVKVFLIGAICLFAYIGNYLVQNDQYLNFAPEFEHTVSHDNFDNLIEATVKMQDISTMERVYRWVAGYQMIKKEPWTGFGPGNFYPNYKDHAVASFRTYVSNNPDKSGIHSYYLMTIVEQGFLGLIIFLSFLSLILTKGEKLYHKLIDPEKKRLIMACLIALIVISSIILINDMLEALKVGALFFLCAAIIMNEDVLERNSSDNKHLTKIKN